MSGVRMIFCTSALMRFTMSIGVPAGANRPIQLLTSKPGRVSATVGVSGSAARAGADHRDGTQLPGLHLWQHGRHGREDHARLAAEQIVDRRRVALVGHVDDVDLGDRLEQFAGEMAGRAWPAEA